MNSSPSFSLKGKNILFSGATGVLGKEMALYLARQEASVLLLGRNPKKNKRFERLD